MSPVDATVIPRGKGRLRPMSGVETGWWVHLFDDEGDPPGTWNRVAFNDFDDATQRRTLVFADGTKVSSSYNSDCWTLTESEAQARGLATR